MVGDSNQSSSVKSFLTIGQEYRWFHNFLFCFDLHVPLMHCLIIILQKWEFLKIYCINTFKLLVCTRNQHNSIKHLSFNKLIKNIYIYSVVFVCVMLCCV